MKWTLPILFLLALTASNGQSKDSVLCLPKSDVITLANKIQALKDTVRGQFDMINWQKNIIVEQDTLIGQQKKRFSLFQEQLDNRQNVINTMEQENKKLRETIDILMPKWYDNKWLWFGGGATVATIILGVIL
jgi:uncharacterized protein with ACT and thioredoxin-like domain